MPQGDDRSAVYDIAMQTRGTYQIGTWHEMKVLLV